VSRPARARSRESTQEGKRRRAVAAGWTPAETDANQSETPGPARVFTLAFPTAAAAALSYAAFVIASPGLVPGSRWRYVLAIPFVVVTAAAVLVIAFLTLLTKGYFPASS